MNDSEDLRQGSGRTFVREINTIASGELIDSQYRKRLSREKLRRRWRDTLHNYYMSLLHTFPTGMCRNMISNPGCCGVNLVDSITISSSSFKQHFIANRWIR